MISTDPYAISKLSLKYKNYIVPTIDLTAGSAGKSQVYLFINLFSACMFIIMKNTGFALGLGKKKIRICRSQPNF